MPESLGAPSWQPIGDLHIAGRVEQNYLSLPCIVDPAPGLPRGGVAFGALSGDNADETPAQFRLLRAAPAVLAMPPHSCPAVTT